jgi:DNA polymerase-1
MQTFTYTLGGAECQIYYPERLDDLAGFDSFLAEGDKVLGLDTETTGLDVYSPEADPVALANGTPRLRLVQIGNAVQAWVLRADLFADAIRRALRQNRFFVMHNAAFDLQVLDRHLGVTIEELGPRVFDTRILAHLLDPRQPHEGGAGLRLKELSAIYVDPDAPDTADGLTKVFNSLKFTKANGWARIPVDHPTYLLYAGLDPILAVRLFAELGPLVRDVGLDNLSKFEHHLQILLAMLQRRGMRVDVPYTEHLIEDLAEESVRFSQVAATFGVPNVNSTKQVGEALEAMGEKLTERTKTGWKVDKEVLMPLADLDRDWLRIEAREPNLLADAVLRSKRAGKWKTAYAEAFLALKDTEDRLHASIGGLQARTARMSVSRPPLQQLPSGDWKVRRAFIADPGQTIIAADYSQVEMRVLAALSRDEAMIQAIADGLDIHDAVATGMFGPGFTKQQRKLAKNTGFGEVFGGGAVTLARQAGVTVEVAKEAKALFAEGFPGIKRYGRALMRRAEFGKKEVITPSGRHLPLDKDRLYSATNYVVQSTARDILAQALVDLFDAGLGEHLLIPVHDEIVAQAPAKDAREVVDEIGRVMNGTFLGVSITSEASVYGPSWGHGYGAPQ